MARPLQLSRIEKNALQTNYRERKTTDDDHTQSRDVCAFTVIKREGQDDFWLPIGATFAHQNGEGVDVILQAFPISKGDGECEIMLRRPKDDENNRRP